jgi:hypothetical protein
MTLEWVKVTAPPASFAALRTAKLDAVPKDGAVAAVDSARATPPVKLNATASTRPMRPALPMRLDQLLGLWFVLILFILHLLSIYDRLKIYAQ